MQDDEEDFDERHDSYLTKTVAFQGQLYFKYVWEKANQIKFDLSKNLERERRQTQSRIDSSSQSAKSNKTSGQE